MDIGAANWNEDDDSNTTAAPDGAPEGMAPSGVNNVLRAIMGAIKRWFSWSKPKTTAGTSTAYTLTYAVAPGSLVDGMTHVVNFDQTCGASPTLNVNGLGAIPIHYSNGAAWAVVPSGMIKADMTLKVSYNASAGTYRIVGAAAPVVAQSSLATAAGYTMLPGATPILIQWGSETLAGLGASVAVTFPAAFSATPRVVQVTAAGDNTKPGYAVGVASTGFTLVNPGTQTIVFYWTAIGAA